MSTAERAAAPSVSRTEPESNDAIVVDGLVKRYGSITAVDGLTFSVRSGEIFALLGPNGAGKTTTVETLEGYRRPDGGAVRVLGLDPIRQAGNLKPQIGLMLQQTSIYAKIRVGEAMQLFAGYYESSRRPEDVLERVGLSGQLGSSFGDLSGGQKQRLSLALAIVGDPRLVFLDEPTASMDPQARLQTWELIRELCQSGVTVLLTTHHMEEAQRLADRVGIIDHGRLIAMGSPEALVGDLDTAVVSFSVPQGVSIADLRRETGLANLREERQGAFTVTATDPLEVTARLNAWRERTGSTVAHLRVTSATLEDVFLRLTGSEVRD